MDFKNILMNLKEGDTIMINGLSLEVTRIEPKADADAEENAKDTDTGQDSAKKIFLISKNQEYHIRVSNKDEKDALVLEKLKKKFINSAWEHEVIAKFLVDHVALP